MYRFILSRWDLGVLGVGAALVAFLVFTSGAVVGFELAGDGDGAGAAEQEAENGEPGTMEEDASLAVAPPVEARGRWDGRDVAGPHRGVETGVAIPSASPATEALAGVWHRSRRGPATGAPQDPPEGWSTPRFALQVGAFARAENARALAQRLQERGYDARISHDVRSTGEDFVLVTIPSFGEARDALAAAEAFETREEMRAIVVALGGGDDR